MGRDYPKQVAGDTKVFVKVSRGKSRGNVNSRPSGNIVILINKNNNVVNLVNDKNDRVTIGDNYNNDHHIYNPRRLQNNNYRYYAAVLLA